MKKGQDLPEWTRAVGSLKPILRAYVLAYGTSTGPRLFTFVTSTLRRTDLTLEAKIQLLYAICKRPVQFNRLPTAAAIIVGGATTVPRLVGSIVQWLLSIATDKRRTLSSSAVTQIRFISSFLAAWLAFDLLNRDEAWARRRAQSQSAAIFGTPAFRSPNQHHLPPPGYKPEFAGKTMDFTLLVLSRALEIAVLAAWTRTRTRSWHPEQRSPRLADALRRLADPSIFALSSAIIMWAWFYAPNRLPRAYNKWISRAAELDPSLLQALRLCRQGDFVYGQDTGQAHLLEPLCKELKLPQEYADPSKTIPIPCELYHSGAGKSCEVHGVSRFLRAWKLSMTLYLPLQLLARIRSWDSRSLVDALASAARSSSFLASFVAAFYYAVCLARTRLGPRLFSARTVTPQMWDSGLCVLAGCLACGWSILLEKPGRRQEIALFVAPRALATLLPRVYLKESRGKEQVVFAASVAVVMSTVKAGNGQYVRGVLGRLLSGVLREG